MHTPEDDSSFTARQLNGIMVLLALAEPETTIVPFSGPSVQLRYTGSFERVDRQVRPESTEPAVSTGRLAAISSFVRTDPMLRNALFLILNSGIQAGLGFAFWIIAARFFDTTTVGKASSLISASNLIAFLGLLGMNTTFVRYLPMAKNRNRLITAGVSLVGVGSGAVALVYVFLMPLVSRPLAFVTHSLPLAAGFVILTAGAGVNLLTDSVFIAAGKSQYNALVDGVIGGGTKIILVFLLASAGAYGVFGAATGGFVIAAFASLLLMMKVLHWRPEFKNFGQAIKPVLSFSGTNYASSILNLLPILIVPLIILDRIDASTEAYYYVSYQLATLLYQAVFSVEQSFLSEGAGVKGLSGAVLKRSIRILLTLCIPAFILVTLFGHQLLSAFGSKYANNTGIILIPLAAAVFPIAAANWFTTVLRLVTTRLGPIVWSNGVSAAVIIGVAWVLAPRGLVAVAMAWPIGCTAGAVVVGVPAIRALRRSLATRDPEPTWTPERHPQPARREHRLS
jgi:O-antigen/teichoic acid export membrane protein